MTVKVTYTPPPTLKVQPTGAPGLSAYAVAVGEGYPGTVEEWLASLVGPAGASAYEAAVEEGFVGDQTAWVASLAGADGQSAYEVAVANGFVGDQAAWLASLVGPEGPTAVSADAGNAATLGTDSLIYVPTPTPAPVDSVNAQTGAVVLDAADVGAAPAAHGHPAADISDATATGQALVTAADAAAARAAIGAGTGSSDFDGAYSSLSGTPTLGTAAAAAVGDFATAAQGSTADSAVQPGDLGTAAVLNVPATGDAAAGEVVKGDDSRLTDARTPTAHAHTVSDVTDAGTAASADVTDFATAAQGGLADSAVQPGDDAAGLGSGAAADGYVLTADGAGGAAFEAPTGGGGASALDDLSDVDTSTTAPTAGQVLLWDEVGGVWKPGSGPYGSGVLDTFSGAVLGTFPYAWYRAEETSGTTAADSSGNARPGTYGGTPVLGGGSLVPSEPGASSFAADSPTDQIVSASIPAGTVSVALAFSGTGTGAGALVFWRCGSASWYLRTTATHLALAWGGGEYNSIVPNAAVYDGQPHLMVVSGDAMGQARLWFDGELVLSLATANAPGAPWYTMNSTYNEGPYGDYSEFAIWDRGLTIAEAEGLYSSWLSGGSVTGAVLNDLIDVDTATVAPSAGDVLTFDGTQWVPGAAGGGAPPDAPAVVASGSFAGISGGDIPAPAQVAAGDYIVVITGSSNPGGESTLASASGLSFNRVVNGTYLQIDVAVSPDDTPRAVHVAKSTSAVTASMLVVRGADGVVGTATGDYASTVTPTVDVVGGDGLTIGAFIHRSYPNSPAVPTVDGWDDYSVNQFGWNTLGVLTKPGAGASDDPSPTLTNAGAGTQASLILTGTTPDLPTSDVPAGGTTGQVLAKASGTDFDTEWVDAAAGTAGRAVSTSTTSVSSGTWTQVGVQNGSATGDLSYASSAFTVATGGAGWYVVHVAVSFNSTTAGQVYIKPAVNGTKIDCVRHTGVGASDIRQGSVLVELAASDVVTMEVYIPAAMTVGGNVQTYLQLFKVA